MGPAILLYINSMIFGVFMGRYRMVNWGCPSGGGEKKKREGGIRGGRRGEASPPWLDIAPVHIH
jgi:hypothetical protein